MCKLLARANNDGSWSRRWNSIILEIDNLPIDIVISGEILEDAILDSHVFP